MGAIEEARDEKEFLKELRKSKLEEYLKQGGLGFWTWLVMWALLLIIVGVIVSDFSNASWGHWLLLSLIVLGMLIEVISDRRMKKFLARHDWAMKQALRK